jgi:hypothetical protein
LANTNFVHLDEDGTLLKIPSDIKSPLITYQ